MDTMSSVTEGNSKRGLHNWRKLFRKPNLYEWVILIMLILSLFIAWAYQKDMKECTELIANLPLMACNICSEQLAETDGLNITFNEEIQKGGIP